MIWQLRIRFPDQRFIRFFKEAGNRIPAIHSNRNKRFACLCYGIKRLSKIEKQIEERLKKQSKRYNKDYPGQILHGDTKRLPLLEGQKSLERRKYLFVAIDDFSRELYAAIFPDKTQYSAKAFLEQVLEECPYTIEQFYSDNDKEYRGDPEYHAFMIKALVDLLRKKS